MFNGSSVFSILPIAGPFALVLHMCTYPEMQNAHLTTFFTEGWRDMPR